MKQFEATLAWRRGSQPFLDQRYSRAHEWRFDGGTSVPASSSPLSVPVPMSDPACVDPEEALVAAASSCHMLFFLSLAAQRGLVVDEYFDHALGVLDTDRDGKLSMTRIVLRPRITWAGPAPDAAALMQIHHIAHEKCYIASSLKGEVVVEEAP
ncbi:OsmC family protein [Massilia solisilvae]|uniref:OsmC family protein n=1 Tax=Massilia solisilvae TaxID=1811225 RepID=A0ABT2BQI7_9BURK|nr:OsmC family protein [Massilia solisilvae]MCS0610759.1 OsmC family protein [Massilia solisilvae]